jgi:8-oxo-dGTP pyrophosphatase MutT (NUDIX family)
MSLRERLAARLLQEPQQAPQTTEAQLAHLQDVYGMHWPAWQQAPLREAAVLVAISLQAIEPAIWLTLRAAHLRDHAGQVSLPGGRLEAGEDHTQAALREAHEEIGMTQELLEPMGFLPGHMTMTSHFWVIPVVAALRPGFVPRTEPNEVREVFSLPVSHILDPAQPQQEIREMDGRRIAMPIWQYDGKRIWGATAAILLALRAALLDDRA